MNAPSRQPRILVTGFSVFPGAPVNPTEALAGILAAQPPQGDDIDAFRADVLAVDYTTIADRLSAIGRVFLPDIVIHFAMARDSDGFRLERLAHNSHAGARPDLHGVVPAASQVCAGPETFSSTLPLSPIALRLEAAGLPVSWSDDAGGYLGNTVFTLSLAHVCDGMRPVMAGLIHVPPLKEAEPTNPNAMTINDLVAGARIVVASCVDAWHGRGHARGDGRA